MTIAEFLKKKKWTRAKLAGKLGVEVNAVGHWISGRNNPRPETAFEIQKVTKGKVTLADIYGT